MFADLSRMFRRFRPDPDSTPLALVRATAPNPALMRTVETAGAAARASGTFREAVGVVLDEVAVVARWKAAHAWMPAAEPGTWRSFGLWFPDDGIGLGELRSVCFDSAPIAPRGHLALALHMGSMQWVEHLGALAGTPVHAAATHAGITSAVACPVYAHGRPVALLEWYLGSSSSRPTPDVANALGHLSGVLTEVSERPCLLPVPVPRVAVETAGTPWM